MICTKVTLKMTSRINDPFTSYLCFLLQYTHQQTHIIIPPQQLHSHSTLFFLHFFSEQSFLKCHSLWHKKHFRFFVLALFLPYFFFFLSGFASIVKPSSKSFFMHSYFPCNFLVLKTNLNSSIDNICLLYIKASTKCS